MQMSLLVIDSFLETPYAFMAFCFCSRPNFNLSRIDSRFLSSLSLVMTTFDGAMPIGTDWPFDFSRTRRSTCRTHFSL